jgi:SAM-dependent methyltransferase
MSSTPPSEQPTPADWGAGHYETFAADLEPVAEHVVTLAAPVAGSTLLDIACGTGNAALIAAHRGAVVSGVDSAARLIEVARERAAQTGLRASFHVADAQLLPFEDRAFDSVVSVFGVIFAADARQTLAEALRVVRPGGRAVLSAWRSGGAVDAMVGTMIGALSQVLGPPPARFKWGDPDAVRQLAAGLDAEVQFHDGTLAFTAESPEAFLLAQEQQHPMSIWGRDLLERHGGDSGASHERALAVLREGNEDPAAFRATSRYHVIEVRRS